MTHRQPLRRTARALASALAVVSATSALVAAPAGGVLPGATAAAASAPAGSYVWLLRDRNSAGAAHQRGVFDGASAFPFVCAANGDGVDAPAT